MKMLKGGQGNCENRAGRIHIQDEIHAYTVKMSRGQVEWHQKKAHTEVLKLCPLKMGDFVILDNSGHVYVGHAGANSCDGKCVPRSVL